MHDCPMSVPLETPVYSTSYVTNSVNQKVGVTNPTQLAAGKRCRKLWSICQLVETALPPASDKLSRHSKWRFGLVRGARATSKQIEIIKLEERWRSAFHPHPGSSVHTSSLYLAIVRLSLEVSTQVTKSSICLS